MSNYRVVSSDSHVFEAPDLWTSRIGREFGDRVPCILRMEDGSDWWICDGRKVSHMGGGSQPGRRFEEPAKLTRRDVFENVRPGGYIPEEHVKDMATDGVDAGVIYPTVGLRLFAMPDSEFFSAMCGAYNDWLAEFCKPYPRQLHGIAMLNIDDVHSGIRELERCATMGLVGGMITAYPPEGRGYNLPEYEPLWAAAEELGIPLSLHTVTNRPGPGQQATSVEAQTPASVSNTDHWVRMSLSHMIFSGVFERHPNLYVGAVEYELAWVPYFLDRIDYTYTQRVRGDTYLRFKDDMLPSDYFHRNVFVGFQEDALGIRLRDIIGVDNLQWGSDYPHFESTFPRSRQILEEILSDCTEEEKAKVAGGNASRLYHID